MLAAVGADFTVVQPPELRDRIRATGALFARATAESG